MRTGQNDLQASRRGMCGGAGELQIQEMRLSPASSISGSLKSHSFCLAYKASVAAECE